MKNSDSEDNNVSDDNQIPKLQPEKKLDNERDAQNSPRTVESDLDSDVGNLSETAPEIETENVSTNVANDENTTVPYIASDYQSETQENINNENTAENPEPTLASGADPHTSRFTDTGQDTHTSKFTDTRPDTHTTRFTETVTVSSETEGSIPEHIPGYRKPIGNQKRERRRHGVADGKTNRKQSSKIDANLELRRRNSKHVPKNLKMEAKTDLSPSRSVRPVSRYVAHKLSVVSSVSWGMSQSTFVEGSY